MKKTVCVLLSALMAASLIGCKKEEETTEKTRKKVTKAEDAAEDEEDPSEEKNTKEDPSDEDTDTVTGDGIAINSLNFPDEGFREYVKENFDSNGDGALSEEEIADVTEVRFNASDMYYDPEPRAVTLAGVEYLTELDTLIVWNASLASADFPDNKKLVTLCFTNCPMESLDASAYPELEKLSVESCGITELILDNPKLTTLTCSKNELSDLNLSSCPELDYLHCAYNHFHELDLSHTPSLTILNCSGNVIDSLDVSVVPGLKDLNIWQTNISSIDLSACPDLEGFSCYDCPITSIDLSGNSKLTNLDVMFCEITSLDVSVCPELYRLDIVNTDIASIDISTNTKLAFMYCDGSKVTSLDISNCPVLVNLVKTGERDDMSDGRTVWNDANGEAQLMIDSVCELIYS